MNKEYVMLQRIAQTLSDVKNQDIGLISGKMGAVIFLFHYARYTKDSNYEDVAMELLDEIQHQLIDCKETSYRSGIAGIAVAIDYLIENEFISADENILDDFDNNLYCAAFDASITDYSLYDGLMGYGWYWLSRMNKNSEPAAESVLLEMTKYIPVDISQLSATESFDIYNFFFELSCIHALGKIVSIFFSHYRRQVFLCEPNLSYPRLINCPAGESARTYLLKRYWNLDTYTPSNMLIDEQSSDLKTLAWNGLYLLSVLSPKEKAWIGLL